MYDSRTLRPTNGLVQSLVFNAAELDKKQVSGQLRTLGKTMPMPDIGPAVPAPLAYEPHPEAAAWQRNLERFLRLVNGPAQSRNPYNNHAFFAAAPILKSGWDYAPAMLKQAAEAHHWADAAALARRTVAPGRSDVALPNEGLVERFCVLLRVSGFDKRFPVLLDRQGMVLDGWHRLLSCAQTEERYFYLQLDF